MTPMHLSARLTHRKRLTDSSMELLLRRPDGFGFEPGQHIRIQHGPDARDYSLASAPKESVLRLIVRLFPHGRMSSFLSAVEIGEEIPFFGPLGYFVYRASKRTPVFVATGTGVAPFVSMCRTGVSGYICLHGAKNAAGLLYAAELKKQAARYVPCLSDDTDNEKKGFAGRVTDYLGCLPADGHYAFYLCGQQAMIRDAVHIIDARFQNAHIHSEIFY